MNPNESTGNAQNASSELDRVHELLPWYAQDALDEVEHVFMKQWLELHLAQHPDIKAELDWLHSSTGHLQAAAKAQLQALPAASSDLGLAEVMQRIAQERLDTQAQQMPSSAQYPPRPRLPNKSDWLARIGDWLKERLEMRSPALAFAMFALILVQAGTIGTLLLQGPSSQEALSGAPGAVGQPAGTVLLTVAFNPKATEQNIRQALGLASGQIVAGPSALGLYLVAVPEQQAAQSMARLQGAKDVVESANR
jgi:hypothetical protein